MEKRKFTIALAGNPNSGKTSIFNNLTGSHQYVGNWPGVTVEKKSGVFKYKDYEFEVIDLPGIYSFTASSLDEKVSADFLLNSRPDVVVVVIDSTNIERNFYLLIQVLEMGLKVVVDLNMIDMIKEKGIRIDTKKLSLILDSFVVETNARDNIGTESLKEAILNTVLYKKENNFHLKYRKSVEKEIDNLFSILKEKSNESDNSLRWKIIEILQGNREVFEEVKREIKIENFDKIINEAIERIEREVGEDDDVTTVIIEDRYAYIQGLIKECVSRELNVKERYDISNRIDKIVTNRFIGIPLFLILMWIMFELVFAVGNPLADILDVLFNKFAVLTSSWLTMLSSPLWLKSLIVEGIIKGVGSVVIFFPNIIILFLYISLLEDSGYMARAAFVMDKLMHTLGLHGKSFIPMILGFGCNVPAIMATRTLETKKDRILTILAIPYISCSARLPIYILFTSIFFKHSQSLIVFSLYIIGIVIAILIARFFKLTFFKHEVAPLIMELPPYRVPKLKFAFLHSWRRGEMFLKKAGTVIVAAVIIIWFLSYFPMGVDYASADSFLGRIGKLIAPIFSPAGFGFWQAAVAILMGVMAKEIVVGTLGTLSGLDGGTLNSFLISHFTPISAYSFMLMSLIYIPCVATIAAIKKEAGTKWAFISVFTSLILGWIISVIFYQIAALF